MTAFAAALDRIFTLPALATSALWVSSRTSEERSVRVIRRAPDLITAFGEARIVSDTVTVDVQVGELPSPRPGDLIIVGTDSHVIQGEPLRDRERLVWTLELRLEV